MENETNTRYLIPEAQEVNVENATVSEVYFENKLIDVPKTGGNEISKVWIILFGSSMVALAGIIICIIVRKKNK